MASYTETAEFIAVSTMETPPEARIKMLPGATVDAPLPGSVEASYSKGKKRDKIKQKKKRCLFMCCSNMQFENEEEKEKALAFLKNENSKLAMVMCCSNFQVGSEDQVATGPRKTAK